jgi:Zn finger protein HypA/HybF involved in hydrogenase expression
MDSDRVIWRGTTVAEDDSELTASIKCRNCGMGMQSLGRIPFRIGGLSGILSSMGEIGEDTLSFDVYVCPKCKSVEFFGTQDIQKRYEDLQRKNNTSRSFLKKCVKCRKEIPIASEECQFCGSKQPPLNKR